MVLRKRVERFFFVSYVAPRFSRKGIMRIEGWGCNPSHQVSYTVCLQFPPPLATPLDTGRTDIPYRYTVNLTTKRHSLLISGRGKALIQSHSDLGTLQVNNQMIMLM